MENAVFREKYSGCVSFTRRNRAGSDSLTEGEKSSSVRRSVATNLRPNTQESGISTLIDNVDNTEPLAATEPRSTSTALPTQTPVEATAEIGLMTRHGRARQSLVAAVTCIGRQPDANSTHAQRAAVISTDGRYRISESARVPSTYASCVRKSLADAGSETAENRPIFDSQRGVAGPDRHPFFDAR